LKLLLGVLLGCAAVLGSLPWWLGGALRPVLRPLGVTFERYEQMGYAHFRLHGVNYEAARFGLTAQQVEIVTPLVWLAQRLHGTEPVVTVEAWTVSLKSGPAEAATARTIAGVPDLHAALQRLGPSLNRWVPLVQLKAGEIRGLGIPLTIASADWRHATLRAEGVQLAGYRLSLVIAPAANDSLTLSARTAGNEAKLQLVWTGTEINGSATVWAQPVQLAARFSGSGWLPVEASAVAAHWQVPAGRIKLGAPYAQVRGDARLGWHDGAFELSLNARAEPAAGTKAPPFTAVADAHGTPRELVLTALNVAAPFATAKLSAPVTFGLAGPFAAKSAELVVQADLGKLPWVEARGQVKGTVTVTSDTAAARQNFQLTFTDVMLPGFTLQKAEARGILHWPQLELTSLTVQLDQASSLSAHGIVNWQTHELSGVTLQAKLDPAWFARWLPAGAAWGSAELTATMDGPLGAPRHQGTIHLTRLQRPPLHPLQVGVSWRGAGAQAEILAAHAATDHAAIDLAGTLDPRGLLVEKFQLTKDGQPGWQLAAPTRLDWSPVWQLGPLQLAGPAGDVAFKGRTGPEGFFALTAAGFDSSWLQDWVSLTGPAWQVHAWQANGRVTHGVMGFDTTLTAQIAMEPQPAQVKLVAHGDAQGLQLQELTVKSADRVLTQATGRLPLIGVMSPAPHLQLDEAAPLELAASTDPDSPLWAMLAAATGLSLTSPTAKIDLRGTLRQPAGELQVRAAKVTYTNPSLTFSPPDGEDLVLNLQLGRERVTLTTFSAKLDGQAVSASGQAPMSDDRWLQLWRNPAAFDWSEAEAKLEIPDADLAPFAKRAPTFIAALGRLHARVELARGGKFSGELYLTDAASRPLPPFGTLQEINADLTLANRTLTVRSLTAKLGSEPVALTGQVTLVPGGAARLDLALTGQNLPLVRNTGLLLRTDLDLHAATDDAGLTRLSGAITVRDCLVLANVNLQTLLPTGRRGVTRQPPYFSVPTAPFQQWALAVDLRAASTVRVRTTAYNGTASARFHLGGTLGEPRAVGELTVDQGQVLLPFATFKVTQGAVRLSEADPFHAMVSLNALSQRNNYQLRMEMTGALPSPNVIISSTPALEAADVLVMVMTGQPPAGAASPASSGQRLALLGAYLGRGLFQDLGFGGEDRVEISSGEHVSRQGRETYEFEYKLRDKWSLVGEYDEFDAYNAGLKWRVYTEEGAPLAKK
jgi:translocation and assembly module TamB